MSFIHPLSPGMIICCLPRGRLPAVAASKMLPASLLSYFRARLAVVSLAFSLTLHSILGIV